jgi:hypothetical protein
VNEGAAATLLTPSKKKIKNIAIFLKDDDESEDEEKENSLPGKIDVTQLTENHRLETHSTKKSDSHSALWLMTLELFKL